jgi:hypothetical protein
MVSYRRNLVPGGNYFFTVNLAERRLGLLTGNIGLLLDSARARRGFRSALASDQKRFLAWFATRRSAFHQPKHQKRTRHLAAAVSGAYAA